MRCPINNPSMQQMWADGRGDDKMYSYQRDVGRERESHIILETCNVSR